MSQRIHKKHVCFFVGHSDAPEAIYDEIFHSIGWLFEQHGVTEFWSGGYGAFDRMCERAVRAWKQAGAPIRLVLVLAYPPKAGRCEQERYGGYDELYLPDLGRVPSRAAIARRNLVIAAQVKYILAWVQYDFGGASKTLAAAECAGAAVYRVGQQQSACK